MAVVDLLSSLSTNPLVALPVVFGSGVLTSLTPCVYPMIPITAAVVGGHAADGRMSRMRAALLTATYVLGLSLVYALLGLLAGLTGTIFGGVSTNPWTSFVMANLLLLFALMMLDIIPVPVPQRLLARAATTSGGGRFAATFVMGAASGLVAAPCGAPVMGAVLAWVASTQRAALGFVYLFACSLGMSAALVVVGLFAGVAARLPRAGSWMRVVKRFFALVMLGVAEYYLISMGQLLL
ncbi:MAG: cytochrome c biogenesis protein CcdA [Gemmatimonadaceae bacterium]